MFFFTLLITAAAAPGVAVVQEWDFSNPAVAAAWQPNAHLEDVTNAHGVLSGRAVDWDPFFTCSGLDIPASPWQMVALRIKADAPGAGELFWTGQASGEHGGFDGKKSTQFTLHASEEFQEIVLLPFWHKEGVIRQLRLDLFDGVRFEWARLAIFSWEGGRAPFTAASLWEGGSPEATGWLSLNQGTLLAAPPLAISLEEAGWFSLRARALEETTLTILWTTGDTLGCHQETIYLRPGDAAQDYHVEMRGHPDWEGTLCALAVQAPEPEHVVVESLAVAPEPLGPPVLHAAYFGLENGVSRAGRTESVLALLTNAGGGQARIEGLALVGGEGLTIEGPPVISGVMTPEHGELVECRWNVKAETAGVQKVALVWSGQTTSVTAELLFEEAIDPAPAPMSYVPEPRPVQTDLHILAYYFPGWDADSKWDPIRGHGPIRKPLLGYYDEANVECVDWQIKWAVENGIRCFLVDWYWSAGSQSLTHWFAAYRKARYRDALEVAIMWANHNDPGTHSREDWRNVTREWIDRYFNLPRYYRIDGKPALFLWDTIQLRKDLGGSDEVAAALRESQEMAQAAGYPGITFVALHNNNTRNEIETLLREGYFGTTAYHEFGRALGLASAPPRGRYQDIVDTAPAEWERRRALSEPLAFYPVVSTGWDSRPWHGPNAMAFHGRTVEGFERLLRSVREYCRNHGEDIVVLGPLNEWGEGSYIEPNLEFGFGNYEAIRRVFASGDPATWPRNLGPRDVGLGPYEFPAAPATYCWTFDSGTAESWAAAMHIGKFRVEQGMLRCVTSANDPALVFSTRGLKASNYDAVLIRMRLEGPVPETATAQIFWSISGSPTNEANSIRFPVTGGWQEYQVALSDHPRWRGRISMIRFDPCDFRNADISIDRVEFLRAGR